MSSRRLTHLLIVSLLLLLTVAAGCRSGRRSGRDRGSRPGPMTMADGGVTPGQDAGPMDTDAGVEVWDAGPMGSDAGPACPTGQALCGEECADLAFDMNHCGSCFHPCSADALCVDGSCRASCTPACAGSACGPDGCGGTCGTCGSGTACVDGLCAPVCPAGQVMCLGTCADPSSDDANCGSCGNACPPGTACTASSCRSLPTGSGETCTTAVPLATSATFNFSGSRADHTPFSCGNRSPRGDEAFMWTASSTGTATFTAAGVGTEVDTTLAVFSSSTCSSAVELRCDDDSGPGLSASLSLSVTAGSTYYVVVSHYSSTTPTQDIRVAVSLR